MRVHRHTPTITEMISLPHVMQVAIAPWGSHVAYVLRTADWEKNRYLSNCFVHDISRNETRKVIENARHPRWMDDRSLAVLGRMAEGSKEVESKTQVWCFQVDDDDGKQFTFTPHGVQHFWPNGDGIIYRANVDPNAETVERELRYGRFIHVGQEPRTDALFYISLSNIQASPLRLTDGLPPDQRIRNLFPSSKALYLNCQFQMDFDAVSVWKLSTSPADLEIMSTSETDENTLTAWEQVDLPPRAAVMDIAPDGQELLLNWDGGRSEFFSNEPWELWSCSISSDGTLSELSCLTEHVKLQILEAHWTGKGIYIRYIDGTVARIARLDETGGLDVLDLDDVFPLYSSGFDIAKTGVMAFAAGGPNDVPEVFVIPGMEVDDTQSSQTLKITTLADSCEDWNWGTVETVRWKSRDDTEIEGVLFKPADFDPTQKYPLIVVLHSGPAVASLQLRLDYDDRCYYPTLQFLARGILVLKPNYRGSDGRGHEFLELNNGNLGVGELWDVESGVDYLIEQGYADGARVGCAGYSHGGYVSAFAATHSDHFVALSVGAGVTNWTTYYATSDFHRFPEKVLGGLPHDIPEAYRRSSPAAAIGNKRTPTLIQHGDVDPIVDFGNAQELYRGLKAEGVWVEFFQYPGMGHSVPGTTPRASRAIMTQNLKWFCHHLLGWQLAWDEKDALE